MKYLLGIAAWAVGALLMLAEPALAQAQRSFVSGLGLDTNVTTNCGRTTPCRTLQVAYGVLLPGGEITVLDSAGFGVLNATMPVTVSAYGAEGAVAVLSVSQPIGIALNAPAGSNFTFNGIVINCLGQSGTTAIQIQGANNVTLDNVVIENCAQGITVGNPPGNPVNLVLLNTRIHDIVGPAIQGVATAPINAGCFNSAIADVNSSNPTAYVVGANITAQNCLFYPPQQVN